MFLSDFHMVHMNIIIYFLLFSGGGRNYRGPNGPVGYPACDLCERAKSVDRRPPVRGVTSLALPSRWVIPAGVLI